MLTDYKFGLIFRDDDGFIEKAVVRFYEGAMDQGRYVRTKKLNPDDLKHVEAKTFAQEQDGSFALFLTPADFGAIKTDDELRTYLNKELKKDTKRTPIAKQKIP